MKKQGKRLWSILLCLVVLSALMTVSAFAEDPTPITGVSFKGISVPVVGDYVQYVDGYDLEEDISGAHKYRVIDNQTCSWRDEEGRAINYGAQVFEAGRTYSISFNVDAKDGYAFTAANIPVMLSNLYDHEYTGSIELSQETSVAKVTFTFTLDGERTYDDIVNFRFYEMRAPKDGDTVSINNGVWAYNNAEVTDRYWTDSEGNRIEFGSKFVGGNSYFYNYEFTAFEGYKFAENISVRANNEVPTNWEYTFNDARTTLHIKIPYFIDTSDTVSSVVVDGMFVPNQTKSTRDWDSNVYLRTSSYAHYQIPLQTKGWYEVDAEYMVDTEYKVTEPVFRAGKQYKMFLIVHAKDGYKFAPPETMSFEFSDIPASTYTYTVREGGADDIIEVVITFTAQFPDDVGENANNPAWCYSYIELKTALESSNIRYVALGNVEDTLPLVSMEETGAYADNRWPGIWVNSYKDLILLGDAQFTAPNAEENVHRVYDHLIQVRSGSRLAISGSGSLTFHGNAVGWTTSVVEVVNGGVLTINSGTVKGDTGNRTSFCYGINVNGGTLYVNDGTVIGTNRHDQAPISAVNLYDGTAYINGGTFYSNVSDGAAGSNHYGLSIDEDGSCYLSGGTFEGVSMPYGSDMSDYVENGYTMTVNGVKTDPASCGTTNGFVEVYQEISNINIHVNSPVAGESPAIYDSEVYLVPEGATVESITWYENGQPWYMNGGNRFEAGSTYTVELTLVAGEGVKFANPLTSATINYQDAEVSTFNGNAEKGVTLTVDLGACPNVVPQVDLTVTAPKEGNTPSYSVSVGNNLAYYAPTGLNTTDYRQWYESLNGIDWQKMSASTKFKAGYYYKLHVEIETRAGYEFPLDEILDPVPYATVNGFTATVKRVYDQDPTDYIAVEYNFGECNDSIIEKVVIQDIVAPVAGAKPQYSCKLSGNGYKLRSGIDDWYRINSITWLDVAASSSYNVYLDEDDTFVPGRAYRVTIYIEAEDGYEFYTTKDGYARPLNSATVNGYTAFNILPSSNAATKQEITYTFICTQPEINTIMLYDLDAPQAGKTPDTAVTAAYPELYTVTGVKWLDEEDHEVTSFEQGRLYTAEITVSATDYNGVDSCFFADQVTAYIDGTEVTGWSNKVTTNDDNTVTIRYAFRKPAQAPTVQYYFFSDLPTGGEVFVGEALNVSWSTTWIPTKTEIQYWDGEMWDQWDVQYPENKQDDYDFENVDAGSVQFRIVAYVGNDPRAVSGEFTVTWKAPVSAVWSGDTCTVKLDLAESGVTVIAASYRGGKMVKLEYLTKSDPTATLSGDTVKVFFLKDGSYAPIREAMER